MIKKTVATSIHRLSDGLGRIYEWVFTSERGSRWFDIDIDSEPVEWSETGLKRFLLLNLFVYFTVFFSVFMYFFGVTPRLILTILLLSALISQKLTPIMAELFNQSEEVNMEMNPPVEETSTFKILNEIFDGGDIFDSIRKHRTE